MTPSKPIEATGQPEPMLTLEELCRACAVQTEFVLTLLEEGVAQPAEGRHPGTWRFSEVQVHQVSVAWRLQRDLGVNPAGAALALQLLDEMETLRAQFAHLGPARQDSAA
ncbi:MAG: chaperone modulatory protein CbpM [Hydrogenophaga sp.]|jgi:chaperone modulatory protein CbpM